MKDVGRDGDIYNPLLLYVFTICHPYIPADFREMFFPPLIFWNWVVQKYFVVVTCSVQV